MPEPTPKLKIPKPLPPETVSLASFHEIYDAIDQNAASQEQVDQAVADQLCLLWMGV